MELPNIDYDKLKEQKEAAEEKARNTFEEGANIQSFDFSTYDIPKFSEKRSKKWISLGKDNLYDRFLIKTMENCPMHKSIIRSKTKQVCGENVMVTDSADKAQMAVISAFLKKVKINKLLAETVRDYLIAGYCFIGITWSKDRKTIANIYPVDFTTIRLENPDEESRQIENCYWSEDWSQHTKPHFKPKIVPIFDTDPDKRVEPNCIMMIRDKTPGVLYYGIPSYGNGTITAAEIIAETSNYMLSSLHNGMSPSLLFNYVGIPSPEEQAKTYKKLNSMYKGSKKAGKFILSYSLDSNSKTTVEKIETTNLVETYKAITDYANSEIIKGHEVPAPSLVGIVQPGSLGNSNETESAAQYFYNNTIAPIQILFENVIQELLEVNGWTIPIVINDSNPINFIYEDTTLVNILTVNELRKRIGYPVLSTADIPNLACNISTPVAPAPIKQDSDEEDNEDDDDGELMATINENVKNLSGRQYQSLLRTMRDFSKGKISKDVASVLLNSGYGITPEQVDKFLVLKPKEQMAVAGNVQPMVDQIADKKKLITKPIA